jgi:hypothetical protein
MRNICLAGFVGLLALGWSRSAHAEERMERTPVVVELFSSEGCSSCPPADSLLRSLDAQPIPGVEVLALEMHVDYWNGLGWADPFSQSAFTRRQARYAEVFENRGSYTPQMVVDGRAEFLGSNRERALDEISRAATESRRDRAQVQLSRSNNKLSVSASVPHVDGAEVLLAFTESGLSSQVTRGENAGQQLSHGPVVRQLRKLGTLQHGNLSTEVALTSNDQQHTRAVVFVQDPKSMKILGAAQLVLTP